MADLGACDRAAMARIELEMLDAGDGDGRLAKAFWIYDTEAAAVEACRPPSAG